MIKKLIAIPLSVFVATMIFSVNPVSAAGVTFNNAAGDYQTLRVANATTNPGSTNSWSGSVNAQSGDTVSFDIYYHNTSNITSVGTVIRLSLPHGNFTNGPATVEIWSQNLPVFSGTANIYSNTSQSIAPVSGSARWYPNGTTVASYLGAAGDSITGPNGYTIGDITPGAFGQIVVRATLSGQQVTNNNNNTTSNQNYSPIVTTNQAMNISNNSATLSGNVNPNNGGNTNAWFEYGTTSALGNTTASQPMGSGNGNWSFLSGININPNTIYYYRAVAQNSYGTSYGSTMSFGGSYNNGNNNQNNNQSGGAPFAATNSVNSIGQNSATLTGSVNANNSNTNTWFEYGTSQTLGYTVGYQSIGSNSYAQTTSYTISNLQSNNTYYYRVVAQNSYGTSYGNILSFVTQSSNNQQNGSTALIATKTATYVYQNAALLNGSVNPNSSLTNAWFEWGNTAALGTITTSQAMGGANASYDYSANLSGLSPNVTYYYRAVAQNSYGTSYGSTLSFTTAPITQAVISNFGNNNTETSVVTQTIETTATKDSQIVLIPGLDKTEVVSGDEVNYTIAYRNNFKSAVNNAVLKVSLPAEVSFISSSIAPTNKEGSNLIFNLGIINGNTQSSITIKAKVNNSVKAQSALVFGSNFNYTDAADKFQTVVAYLTAIIKSGTPNGTASLMDTLNGLFGSGWFGLITLITTAIFGALAFRFFRMSRNLAPLDR